jgi:hypothetical protein
MFEYEVKRALERHDNKEVRVIPIILRPFGWEHTSFGKLQPLPRNGEAVTMWNSRDKAFYEIAQGIISVADEIRRKKDPGRAGEDEKPGPGIFIVSQPQLSPSPRFFPLISALQRVSERIKKEKRWLILLSIFTAIITLLALFGPQGIYHPLSQPLPTLTTDETGQGIILVDEEYIGISTGKYALDTNRGAGSLMLEASESLQKGNVGNALVEWREAHEKDTSDAEPLIYIENQRVLASGSPYITIVLGLSLGEKVPDGFSRDHLQAAYIAQKECNDNPQLFGGKMLRLLIAKSGSNPDNVRIIAQEIVKVAKKDKTIVGIQSWPTSLMTLNAVTILASAHLPIVGADTASDALTGISPYFFRVGASSSESTPLKVNYIEKQLSPQHLVIFRDHTEPFSSNSAANFAQQFTKDGYHIASIEDFKTAQDAQDGKLTLHVKNVLKKYKPGFINVLCRKRPTPSSLPTASQLVPQSPVPPASP